MTGVAMDTEVKSSRKPRGKGKNPAKTHVNVRLPADVLEFYRQFPNYTGKMREVLTDFMRKQTAT
jgi:uncharacterized protein (DUF4415 family)